MKIIKILLVSGLLLALGGCSVTKDTSGFYGYGKAPDENPALNRLAEGQPYYLMVGLSYGSAYDSMPTLGDSPGYHGYYSSFGSGQSPLIQPGGVPDSTDSSTTDSVQNQTGRKPVNRANRASHASPRPPISRPLPVPSKTPATNPAVENH